MSIRNPQSETPCRAFTLVELVIVIAILGILAALVIPKFAGAADVARASGLRDDLRQLRMQITLYRTEHKDVCPGYPAGLTSADPTLNVFVAQLTQYTDADGNTSATRSSTCRLGPYLTGMPVNPINDSSEIRFIAAAATFPTSASGSQGWVYQPSTGALAANVSGSDSDGVNYIDY